MDVLLTLAVADMDWMMWPIGIQTLIEIMD